MAEVHGPTRPLKKEWKADRWLALRCHQEQAQLIMALGSSLRFLPNSHRTSDCPAGVEIKALPRHRRHPASSISWHKTPPRCFSQQLRAPGLCGWLRNCVPGGVCLGLGLSSRAKQNPRSPCGRGTWDTGIGDILTESRPPRWGPSHRTGP